jgi:hypothetical protein
MKYEYDGFVIDLKDILYMKKVDIARDGDKGLRLNIQLRSNEILHFEAIVKYIKTESGIITSDYPLQKLRKFYNTFKTFEEETRITRIITKEGNVETIQEIIVRK